MNIIIKSHTMELTNAIRQYALDKMNTLATKDRENIKLDIELGLSDGRHHKSKDHYYCKVNTLIGNRKIHIECSEDDMYKAIDSAREKVDAELAQKKDRMMTRARNLSRRIKSFIKFT